MPNKADRYFFLAGLILFIVALVLIFSFGSSHKTETTIDYIHWLMLISSVLMLPFAINLREHALAIVASVLITIGVICVVGMCVVDMVFWGIGDEGTRSATIAELVATPSIWWPFMLYGSEEVLYAGFVWAAACYWKVSKVGPILVVLGAVLAIIGPSWFNVAGASATAIGFLTNFRKASFPSKIQIALD